MHQIFIVEKNIIIYDVSTFGQETVEWNGQELYKTSVNNLPNIFEIEYKNKNGEVEFIKLESKLNISNQIVLSLYHKGKVIEKDVKLQQGKFKNKYKKQGIAKLENFELEDARLLLENGLKITPYDAEIYFHLACINSLQEEVVEGIKNLQQAIDNGLQDKKIIKTHGKLAYLRMQNEFRKMMQEI